MNRFLLTAAVLLCSTAAFSIGKEKLYPIGDQAIERVASSDFMQTPAKGHQKKMRVLVVAYLPSKDGVNLDEEATGIRMSLADMKAKLWRMNTQAKFMLEEGSKYKGYADPKAKPFLGYEIVDYLFVYDDFKQGMIVPWKPEEQVYRPDYFDVLERVGGEYYVNELGVDEVWLWGWHHGKIEPAESNMSSPTTKDVSNSERTDDLPVYNSTYVLYNYSMSRDATEAVHNHGHQIEAVMMYANEQTDDTRDLFLKDFVGWKWEGKNERHRQAPIGRCGDTHHPANTTKDYDYYNETLAESDIMDWKPDRSGKKTLVNCHTWGDIPYAWPDGISPVNNDPRARAEAHWYIFWMQNIPGYKNDIDYNGKRLTNWFEYIADWDHAIRSGYKMYK